jgi:pimeloyl-ACP methyl ester carboxylesterase
MTYLGQYYRCYALDFWGFGESGRKLDTYQVPDFVALVNQFMDQMGIINAPLVGHSMGGTVSLLTAISHPDRITKVTIIGSPIVGTSLALPLKFAGNRFIASVLFRFFDQFRAVMRAASPLISRDPRFPDMMDRDLSKTTLESFLTSIASLHKTDLRPQLSTLEIPVMGMFGHRDNIVSPNQWKPLLAGLPNARIERFPKAGHFIMLDEPPAFMQIVKDFLDTENTLTGN